MPTARAFVPGITALAVMLLACGTGVERTMLSDGTYKLKCPHELGRCLAHMEEPCALHGYDVIRAGELRKAAGPNEYDGEQSVRSEALVRCRGATDPWWFDQRAKKPVPASEPLPTHAPLPSLTAPPSPAATAPAPAAAGPAPVTPAAAPAPATPAAPAAPAPVAPVAPAPAPTAPAPTPAPSP